MIKLPGLAAIPTLAALVFPSLLEAQAGFGGIGGFGGGRSDPTSHLQAGQNPEGIGFAPFVALMGTYNYELSTTSNNQFFGRRGTWGANGTAGISGAKGWEHTSLGGGYIGSVNYYPYTTQDKWSQNHLGSITAAHVVSPRFSFFGSAMAGTSIGGYGGTSGFGGIGGFGSFSGLDFGALNFGPGVPSGGFGATTSNGLVDSELYNVRTNFYGAVGGLSYRLSERWFASASGGTSSVRRKQGLYGTDWQFAGGQIGYELSRRDSIGFVAQQSWVNYPNAFGEVQGQVVGIQYSRQINVRSSLQAFGGALRIRSVFIGVIPIDPEVAELLGTSTTYAIQNVERYSSSFGAAYSYSRQRTSVGVRYFRGISPGNGLLLTGIRDSAGVGLTTTVSPKWVINFNSSVDKTSSVVGVMRTAYGVQATVGTGYNFFRRLSWTVNAGWRSAYISGTPSRTSGLYAATGIGWSPREFALSF